MAFQDNERVMREQAARECVEEAKKLTRQLNSKIMEVRALRDKIQVLENMHGSSLMKRP